MRYDEHLLRRELEKIKCLPLTDLRRGFAKHLRRRPPDCFTHDLLRRAIAHAIEEKLAGRTLSRELDRTPHELGQSSFKTKSTAVIAGPRPMTMRPGTELIRIWQERPYKVVVGSDGFQWNGETYKSLSEIARAITGTRWNGPRFFGLRESGGMSLGPSPRQDRSTPSPSRPARRSR